MRDREKNTESIRLQKKHSRVSLALIIMYVSMMHAYLSIHVRPFMLMITLTTPIKHRPHIVVYIYQYPLARSMVVIRCN